MDEARAIARIRRLAPDLDPWSAFYYDRLVVFAGSDRDVLRRLDIVLAFVLPSPQWKDSCGQLALFGLNLFVDRAHYLSEPAPVDPRRPFGIES